MTYKRYTKSYINIVFKEFNTEIAGNLKNNKELGEAIKNTIFDKNVPRIVLNQKPNKRQLFIANKIYRPLSEILSSLEAIENISIYIGSFPYKRQGVSKISYLKYHIENYLNELYILKLRLERYGTVISRAYKKNKSKKTIGTVAEALNKYIQKAFQGCTKTRGNHVHEYRYTDKDLDRLSTLSLLSNAEDKLGTTMKWLFKLSYSEVRKKWVGKINSNMEEIHKLLEIYFKTLRPVVSNKGKIIYPLNKGITNQSALPNSAPSALY